MRFWRELSFFLSNKFPDSHRFMQDKVPSILLTMQRFRHQQRDQLVEDASRVPDLNPIENLWYKVKKFTRVNQREMKSQTKQNLLMES